MSQYTNIEKTLESSLNETGCQPKQTASLFKEKRH